MLKKSHIASHQRGRSETKYLPEREIPWHYCEHRSEWLKPHKALFRISFYQLVGQMTRRIFSEIPAGRRALFCFLDGSSNWFAHLARHQPGKQVFFGFEDFRSSQHHSLALCK